MASPTSGQQPDSLVTCPTCDYTVPQAPGKKRTICPNCGNFYSKEAAELATTYRRNRPRQQQNDTQSTSQTKVPGSRGDGNREGQGRQNVLSNLFHNLRPGGRKSANDPTPDNSNDTLPRIDTGCRSHLTTPSHNTGPSYGAPVSSRGETSGTAPCGANCIHHKRQGDSLKPDQSLAPDGVDGRLSSKSTQQERDIFGSRHSPRRLSPSLAIGAPTQRSGEASSTKQVRSADQLKSDFLLAKESGNWRPLLEFYTSTFGSFSEVNAAFKRDPAKEYKTTEDPGLKFDFINLVFDVLIKTPQGLQKEVLKAVINALLKDKRNHDGRI